jgi:two-component system, OmpR family, osmolarity sensor histidine kinase EnvZ
MKERITRSVLQRTVMLAGISHDLRTPMTRMKLQLAMMPETSDTKAMRADIDDMELMVDGYLAFIRGEGDEPSQKQNLVEMLNRIAAQAQRQNFSVRLNIQNNIELEIRLNAFERALTNLVENARKYAHSAVITLQIDQDNEWVLIIVDDDGPGILNEHYEDAFKPFHRLEVSRNRKTGGIGLGMAIAQDIVLSHGGHISLDRSPFGGLRVFIRLPL